MTFHIGQRVVCVDALGNCFLMQGVQYTVSGFRNLMSGVPGVYLAEVSHRYGDGSIDPHTPFYASRFRPIVESKTDISIFTKMLTGVPNELEGVK